MKKKRRFFKWILVCFICLATVLVGTIVADKLSLTSTLTDRNKFYEGTFVNGIDVSGMTVNEVSNIVATRLNQSREDVSITLKYKDSKCVIQGLKRISKPGLRIYAEKEELPRVLNGLGIAIISTSKGIVTDKVARNNNVGGEVIAYIW